MFYLIFFKVMSESKNCAEVIPDTLKVIHWSKYLLLNIIRNIQEEKKMQTPHTFFLTANNTIIILRFPCDSKQGTWSNWVDSYWVIFKIFRRLFSDTSKYTWGKIWSSQNKSNWDNNYLIFLFPFSFIQWRGWSNISCNFHSSLLIEKHTSLLITILFIHQMFRIEPIV